MPTFVICYTERFAVQLCWVRCCWDRAFPSFSSGRFRVEFLEQDSWSLRVVPSWKGDQYHEEFLEFDCDQAYLLLKVVRNKRNKRKNEWKSLPNTFQRNNSEQRWWKLCQLVVFEPEFSQVFHLLQKKSIELKPIIAYF